MLLTKRAHAVNTTISIVLLFYTTHIRHPTDVAHGFPARTRDLVAAFHYGVAAFTARAGAHRRLRHPLLAVKQQANSTVCYVINYQVVQHVMS